MGATHKPEGYTSVSPYLIVDGASDTIAFLVNALGAQEIRRIPHEDGRVMHAEVRIDDTVVMLSDGDGSGAVPSHVHVYVPDVDTAYRKAVAAGATPVQEPVKAGDPDRRGGVRDAGGTTWWLATKVD